MQILDQLTDVYNTNTSDWKVIIQNSDDLEHLSLINDTNKYNLVHSNGTWTVYDQTDNIISTGSSIEQTVNNIGSSVGLTNKESITLHGVAIRKISRSSRRPVYVIIDNIITYEEWKNSGHHWWLPIYDNLTHFRAAQSYFEENIARLVNEFEFNSKYILDIIPKLLIRCSNEQIQSELNKIMWYYLNNNSNLYNFLKQEIEEFEKYPHIRKKSNLLCVLIKNVLLCGRPKKYFMIKFWTEYWARRMKWLHSRNPKVFKMFYKFWHIDLDYLSDKFIDDLNYFDSIVRNILKLKLVIWRSIYDWYINYLDLVDMKNDVDECVQKIKKSVRYGCLIAFKQGYIPFNANHFNKNIS